MAVPTNARILRGTPLKSGVILGVSPSSDPTFDVEIARATSSGVYATLGRLTPKGSGVPVSFTDLLPLDNATRYYKARAVKDGWDAGDYTSPVSGKPVPLPDSPPNITPLTGKGIGSPLFISTGSPPTVGQAAAAASVRKYVTFPFTSVVENLAGGATPIYYDSLVSDPVAYAGGAPAQADGVVSGVLPPGVTIRSLALSGKIVVTSTAVLSTSGDWVRVRARVAQTDFGGTSTFAALSIFTTAAMTASLTTLATVVSTDNLFFADIGIRTSNPTAGNRGGFTALTVGYDMPSYDKAV